MKQEVAGDDREGNPRRDGRISSVCLIDHLRVHRPIASRWLLQLDIPRVARGDKCETEGQADSPLRCRTSDVPLLLVVPTGFEPVPSGPAPSCSTS